MRFTIGRPTSLLVASIACLTLAGCDRAPTDVESLPQAANIESAEVQSPWDLIGKTVALGRSDNAVRDTFFQALSRSSVSDHVISLDSFVATPSGTRMMSQGAAALGVAPETVQQAMRSVGPLDIYVPDQAVRRSWNGSGRIWVIAHARLEAGSVRAFGDDGAALDLRPEQSQRPVVLIEPAEERGTRLRQTQRIANRIEGANESQLGLIIKGATKSGTKYRIDVGGKQHSRINVQAAMVLCNPEEEDCSPEGGGGGGGSTQYFGMALNTFVIRTDHEALGSMEIEFHFSTVLLGYTEKLLRYTGVNWNGEELPREVIWNLPECGSNCTFASDVFSVQVFETDFGFDDYLGYKDFNVRNGGFAIHHNPCFDNPAAYIDPCFTYPSLHQLDFSVYYSEN